MRPCPPVEFSLSLYRSLPCPVKCLTFRWWHSRGSGSLLCVCNYHSLLTNASVNDSIWWRNLCCLLMCIVTFENSRWRYWNWERKADKNQLLHTQHLPVVIQIPCKQTAKEQNRLIEGGASHLCYGESGYPTTKLELHWERFLLIVVMTSWALSLLSMPGATKDTKAACLCHWVWWLPRITWKESLYEIFFRSDHLVGMSGGGLS